MDIENQCRELAKLIVRKKIDYDIIIGLARGGWVPARILSDLLNNDDLYNMRVKFYTGIGQTGDKPVILHPTQYDVKGKNVLLVDDIADTGQSLTLARDHLKEREAGNIYIITLVKKPHTKIQPDLYIEETSHWVIFPWEVRETMRDIIRDLKSDEEVVNELLKAGINMDEYEEEMHNHNS